ncbi:MAG: restriction endonuclease [Leadbetterella sp.]|nr:restriction endonuclease [Leadbetterella sp.]
MKWQEYQEAVGQLYEQMNDFGIVKKNITIPDKVTGQARQVDVWWEMSIGGHIFKILIDAKKRNAKIDVKDVEEILMLAESVNADKAIIVTNQKWTEPAERKANHTGLDLRILSIDEATDLIIEDKWLMCQVCQEDCVVLDNDGFVMIDNIINWWLGGTCRECKSIYINCQSCGGKGIVSGNNIWTCNCPLDWSSIEGRVVVGESIQSFEFDELPFKNENQLEIEFPEE